MSLEEQVLGRRPPEFAHAFGLTSLTAPPQKPPGEPRYITFPDRGVSVVLDESDIATTLQLHAEGMGRNYKSYKGPLPHGLTFQSTRDDVRRAFGVPVRFDEGGLGRGLFGRMMFPWDLFFTEERATHFEYGENNDCLRLVSISIRGTVNA